MLHHHFFGIVVIVFLFVSTFNAECSRNDNLQDEDNFVETVKRFLIQSHKKTTPKPSSDTISALVPTTTSRMKGFIFQLNFFLCLISLDVCGGNNPCKNGGTCRTLPSGRHYCFCTDQYYGNTCEKSNQNLLGNFFLNIPNSIEFKSTGYNTNNQSKKDHCSKSPCRNSGECIPTATTYFCRCKTPYYGLNCDKRKFY
jgi:hypothetical protein